MEPLLQSPAGAIGRQVQRFHYKRKQILEYDDPMIAGFYA